VGSLRRADPSQLRLVDGLLLFWCTVWIVVGIWVGHEIWQLSRLGGTLAQSGQALDDSGRALQELRDVPIIGDAPGAIGDEVRRTAADVVSRGREAQASTRQLAVLLGLTTALLPTVPVLLYLPLRLGAAADRRRVRELVGTLDEQELDTHLARRALQELPYERLLRVSPAPERDFEAGRRRALADAELARLGLRRTGA